MSFPEPSTCPVASLPPKLESNFRPPVAQKPCSQTDSPPRDENACMLLSSGGLVKSIVDRFSHPETKLIAAEKPTHCTPEPHTPVKKLRRAPTVKPKPGRTTLQQQAGGDQAPPLPLKRSRILRQRSDQAQKESPGAEEGSGVSTRVERRRSAPDGKEVDLRQNGRSEAAGGEHGSYTLTNPCCDRDCGCVCHLQRPGMRLIWVPVGEEEDEGEESGLEDVEGEFEVWGEEGQSGSSDGDEKEEAIAITNKSKFHHVLDGIMAEGNRRRSDPGPHGVLSAVLKKHPQSPPIPPKRTQSPDIRARPSEEEEEDSIYEATLLVVEPMPKKTTPKCQELELPLIRVLKSARRSKLSSSSSDPSLEFQSDSDTAIPCPQDSPPAVPPRMPVVQEKCKSLSNLTPVHRGGIPLPQPTAEEWHALRLSSPKSHSASPLTPQRAAPPLPKDSKRLSIISVQSLNQQKEQERNGAQEEDEEEHTDDEFEHVTLSRKGRSLDWESRLQDEPLYQTYRATVITKEIRRQTVCRNISKTSADYPMDSGARRGTTASLGTVAPLTPGQSTLWQDLPHVRDSGVLETLTSEQCKYQESMFEVLTSEASYLRSLRVLTEHFLDSRDLEDTMIIRERKTLFSNILRVREVSERFLKDLEDRMDEGLVFSDINDIIHYHAQHNFPAYIDYVRNQIYQEKTYTSLMKNNVQFATVITRLQESPQCQRLPFMSFLLLPFQRITRIKMLIENILKRTHEGTKEEQTASKALDSVSKIINECNTQVGKMKQVEELIHLSKMLEFDKLKAIPIISQTRFLEKKGELMELSKGGTLFNMRGKFIPIQLLLFNDLLIIANKKGTERLMVLDHAHRSLVQVQPYDSSSTNPANEHCFCLTMLENHQGRMMEKLLKAPSQSDLHRWIAAFPNPSNPDQDEEEVIYEDWDCPQVQCVEQYVAQQADELTLEPTEIINVVRKTNEGMYEGIRLSDGQKGWFPVANVLEITNEHVRRRNLRERYRVMQAARIVTDAKGRTVS